MLGVLLEVPSGLPRDLEGNEGNVWAGDSEVEGGDEGGEEEEEGTA